MKLFSALFLVSCAYAADPSWLRVERSRIVNEKGEQVHLKGFNWPELEFGSAVGGSVTRVSPEILDWFHRTFQMNVWRLPLNSAWWNEDVDVPQAGMRYREWFLKVVEWCKRGGNYVIVSPTTQYSFPPCGGQVKHCASQDLGGKKIFAGRLDEPGVQEQIPTGAHIEPVAKAMRDLARIFANDPAILYDSFNEMHDITPQVWRASTESVIGAIRKESPRSIVFIGGPNWKNHISPLIEGAVEDFPEPNLVFDFHVYNGYKGSYEGRSCNEPLSFLWRDWPANAEKQVGWSLQHGKAAAITEWGGRCNTEEYNDAL
jgi:endoglucanase